MKFSSLKLFLVLVVLGIICFYGSAQATWEAPSAAPPGDNRPRPLNVGTLAQEKTGSLILSNATNALIIKDQSPLIFGDPLSTHVGFKAPASILASVTWTLPVSDGANGYVLATNSMGQLYWANPTATMGVDGDWRYLPSDTNYNEIYSQVFTRVGSSSTTLNMTSAGNGDLYVQNRLEVDGNSYLKNIQATGLNLSNLSSGSVVFINSSNDLAQDNANFFWNNTSKRLGLGTAAPTDKLNLYDATSGPLINLQGLAANYRGLKISTTGSVENWFAGANASNNFVVRRGGTTDDLTINNGKVGVGVSSPAKTLDVAGDIKLSGLIFDSAGTAPNSGQLLSNTGSNVKWIDPAFMADAGNNYFYATKNIRIGNTGTVNQATGVGDLYVQNKLEVDGNTYLQSLNATTITATGLNITGFPTGVVPFQGATGLTYDASNLFWDNTSKHLGLGTSTPTDFTLQVAGDVGPNINNTYSLGSANKRWKNIFATNIDVTGAMNLGFATGSVVFQGTTGLAQNNNKFFWDNTNSRLGLGTNTPSQTLAIDGSLAFLSSNYTGTSGVLFIGGKRFLSSIGSSYASLHGDWVTEENTNTFLGSLSGAPLSLVDDQLFLTDNTGIGFSALINSTIGAYNTAVGSYSLHANIDGTSNTAVGVDSLMNNISGSNLTAVGFGSLGNTTTGTSTTAIGYSAGIFNSSGSMNFFAGNEAGFYNDSGEKNVNIGYQSGYNNIAGSENVFIGSEAGYNNKATGNVMIGSGSGANNTNGSGNVFLGAKAGFDETGSSKLYIEASKADGDSALIFGQFYTASVNPFLRFNGKVGISPRGSTSFTPSKLLHLYQTSGDNAEIDIQSKSTTGSHWGIYQDRTDSDLRFWQSSDKVIFSDGGQVAIGGAIVSTTSPNNLLLRVYGSTESNDYWSADNNQKGGTAYICTISRAALNGGYVATRMRFEDGLYICSCSAAGQDYCDTCTCTNP